MMQPRELSLIFDMLPTPVQSLIPVFALSTTLSILSPWRHAGGKVTEETVVTGRDNDNGAGKVTDVDFEVDNTEVEMGSVTQSRQEAEQAIRWRYAEQGTSMHRIAYLEKEDMAFSRKSYVDGLAYMLMALPENLNNQETTTIRKALPPAVVKTNVVIGTRGETIDWPLIPESRTILRRWVASLVAALVVLVHLVLTCIASVVRMATRYERKYAIVQRLVSKGVVIAATVGGHGVVLSTKVYGMREGRVGKTMNKIVTWTVENVTYGIQEGLGEGLTRLDKSLKDD